MNRLKFMRFYLVGPMDRDREGGKVWRKKIERILKERFKCLVFNPYDKLVDPIHNDSLEHDDNFGRIKDAISSGDFALARELMKPVVAIDLRTVDHSDVIICYLDLKASPCGSYDEIFTACDQNKPVIIMCPQGVNHIPNWLFGRCRPEMFFDKWEHVINYLVKADSDPKFDTLNKWKFFNVEGMIMELINQNKGFSPIKPNSLVSRIIERFRLW